MAEPGQTVAMRAFGRYRVFGELGRGAMGVVYRGFDPVIGRVVALKTLFEQTGDGLEKDLRERLYREAAAAGALSHPNIVTIYDIVESRGVTAVAMELVEGRSLADILTETGSLAIGQALDILEQICSALDYAASRGVVHRDIKPANILLTATGQAKITDFGIARLAQSNITKAGTVLGSPNYMSPEQVRGLPVDGRSDLFAASLVFYEMLTRERPFSGKDAVATMHAIAEDPPLLNPSVGSGVMGVLLRALEKEPEERYPTGAVLVSELRRVTGVVGTTPTATKVPTGSAAPVAAPGDVSKPAGGAPDARRSSGPSPAVQPSASTSKRRRRTVLLQGIGSLVVLVAIIGFLIYKGTSGPAAPVTPPGETPSAPPPRTEPAPPTQPAPTVPNVAPGAAPALQQPAPARSAGPAAQKPAGAPSKAPSKAPPKAAPKTAAPTVEPSPVAPPPVAPPPVQAEAPPPPVVAPAPAPPPPPPGKVFEQNEVDVAPAVATTVPVEYPPDALRRRVEDTVVVRVLVNASGGVDDVRLLGGGSRKDAAFNRAALASVRQWTFKPAQKSGRPVACWLSYAVPFRLPK